MDTRKRTRNNMDSPPLKKKREGSPREKQLILHGEDTSYEEKELPPNMDSKRFGAQDLENSSFLGTVQNGWDKLLGYLKDQANSILKIIHVRERKRDTVGQSSAKLLEENGIGKKRKQQNTIPDDSYDEASGPSRKQIKTTVPLTIDNFVFHKELGEGAFGKVIMATDTVRNECVALKMVKKTSLRTFSGSLIEHQILRIAHKSHFLIHGYAAFHTENEAYYVTELATGGDLLHYVCENQLNMDTIKFITAEIICGLQFMHSNGIIHKDIKLDNILLTGDGHVKITDFGLAQYDVHERVNARDYLLPPGYGPPKAGTRPSYATAADWYALGVVLFNMIFYDKPFPVGPTDEFRRKVMSYQPSCGDVTDQETADILSRLLCRDKTVRLGVTGDIKSHPFFSNLNWTEIETGKAPSPIAIKNNIKDRVSTPTSEASSEEWGEPMSAEDQSLFDCFPFVGAEWSTSYHPA